MALDLPDPGEKPWGTKLNSAIESVDIDLQSAKATLGSQISSLDSRLDTVETQPASGDGDETVGSWFNGRQWYALGTSLTNQHHYTDPLAAFSGMIQHNFGMDGGCMAKGGVSGGNGYTWDTLQLVAADAEVVTLETTGDFRVHVKLGTIDDPEDETVSYYGAMKKAAAYLLTNRPAARVIFFTTYADAYPAPPNFKVKNNQGLQSSDYNDAMRVVGRMYGIPVIEVGGEAGLNYYTMPFYATDGIHMNALGGQRYAEYVWSKIKWLDWGTSRPTAPAITTVNVTGVTIFQGDSLPVALGTTQQLTAVIAPAIATNKAVTWSTSNGAVATVNANGLVTPVTIGTANITATTVDGGFTDVCVITVAGAISVTGVILSPPTVTLGLGSTLQLTATVAPSNASNKAVSYLSSDTGKVIVNSTGLVEGAALGNADITVTTADGGFTDVTPVTVASEWNLNPQTTFRSYGVTGLTNTGSNPTYATCPGGPLGIFGYILINTSGQNAIEFTVSNGAVATGIILGTGTSGVAPDDQWMTIGDLDAPLNDWSILAKFDRGLYEAPPISPISPVPGPAGWATGTVYRVGRVGTRVVLARMAGSVPVVLWDGDLVANWGSVNVNKYGPSINLGVIAYGPPGSAHILPTNCKTGVWTPS